MRSWKLKGVALGAAAVLVVAGAAQASGGRTPHSRGGAAAAGTLDPEHLPRVLPHGVFGVDGSAAPASGDQKTATTNGLIVSDLAIYVSNGTFTSLAAEGHLALHLDTGTHYVGTFMDDLGGGAIFKASASGIQPTGLNGRYTLATGNGTFHFTIGTGGFTSRVPSTYGSTASIGTILYGAHAYAVRPALQATLGSFTIGAFHRPVSGTLSLTTDALGYIVPFSAQRRVNSSWSYFRSGSLHTYHLTSPGRYYPPDGSGDGSLTTVLGVGKHLFSLVDVKEDTSGQSTISGNAVSGSGSSGSLVSFSAH